MTTADQMNDVATLSADVLIAGAGPTGLLLACELQRLGVKVLIVDPKSGPTRESRAMFVHARSLEIYDQLGLGRRAVAGGHPAEGISLWSGLERLGGFAFGPIGAGRTPYPFILAFEQSANEALLYETLQRLGGEVRWGWTLSASSQTPEGVTAQLTDPAEQPHTVAAHYLCGADGAHSAVRQLLGTAFEGDNSPRTLFVADVVASGLLDAADLNLKLSATSLLLAFPMSGQDRYRLIGMAEGRELETDAPTFEAVRPSVKGAFGVEVSAVHWFSHYRVRHRVARHFGVGRVFLLGDAAHVHSPVGGQGMNTGLGDAHNLAWKLAAVVKGRADAALLASYELERRPFAKSLVRTTDRVFRLASGQGEAAQFVRHGVMPGVLRRVLPRQAASDTDRANAAGRFIFGTLSQIGLSYPQSPLSVGRAGRVRGGQRLPYVSSEDRDGAAGNFAALQEPGVQLHVYGTPSREVLAWTDAQEEIALKVFPFDEAARRAGLAENAAYLVRPDGYISVAQDRFDGAALERVLRERWGWRRPVVAREPNRSGFA